MSALHANLAYFSTGVDMAIQVAIIGSFRKERYDRVLDVHGKFVKAGLDILSPTGAEIVNGEEFVRFSTDNSDASDAEVQLVGRISERVVRVNTSLRNTRRY